MKLHILQHVAFEGPGYILQWAKDKGAEIGYTKFYETYSFPDTDGIDLLVIMGGPMSVHDAAIHPWLKAEIAFIKKCLDNNVAMLGICLGAQLIATTLGAAVTAAANKEVGWFLVKNETENQAWPWHLFNNAPTVFHWHGEQFGLPENSAGRLLSLANNNQGFLYGHNVVGFQFHAEATAETVAGLLEHAREDISPNKYVQNEQQIQAGVKMYAAHSNEIMRQVLDGLIQ